MRTTVFCLPIMLVALSSCRGEKDEENGPDCGQEPYSWLEDGHRDGDGHELGHVDTCGQWHGCGHGHGHEHIHKPCNSTVMELASSNSKFAIRMYKQIVSQPEYKNENVLFSPISLSVALAALTLGARGETYDALFDGLAFNDSDITEDGVHEGFRDILQNLNEQKGIDLKTGSALFIGDSFKPKEEFLDDMKTFYLSDGFTTDFTKTREAAKMINDYVNNKTNGKISNLVDELDPATVMYLVSYIYFKGKWEFPFNPKQTKDGLFKVNDTVSVPVRMMTDKHSYKIYCDKEASTTVLQLPYTKSVSMLLLLPDKDLSSLEDILSPLHVAKWLRCVAHREARVYIPKLSIETSYSLGNLLREMGMSDIFSKSANFSGIADTPVLVSEVVQKATLDVDEAGSTASAATGVDFMFLSFTPFVTITFDRPFMVLITNHDTRSILFMGKVINPAEK